MDRLKTVSAMAVLSIGMLAAAAPAQKRPITPRDFDTWKSISGPALSNDGRWLAYGLFPQEGDGEVVVRDLKAGTDRRFPAGQLPPPPAPDPAAEGPEPPRAIRLNFTNDSKTLVFLAYATRGALDAAKKEKKGPAHEELVTVDLAGAIAVRTPDVKNFQLPEKADGFVTYQKYGAFQAPPGTGAAAPASDEDEDGQAGGTRGTAAGNTTNNAQYGSTLVLRTLAGGSEREFADVLEYQMANDGKTLAYSVAAAKTETDGVFAVATAGADAKTLIAGKGRYQHLIWNDKLNELAFVGNPGDDAAAKKPGYNLYLWKTSEAKAANVVSTATPGFRAGFVVNDHAALTFSKDGTRLFFGAAPPPPPSHATAIDEDKPSFDLWNYKDDYIQSIQKSRAGADINRAYRAVYVVPQKKMVQIADETMPEVVPNEQGRARNKR